MGWEKDGGMRGIGRQEDRRKIEELGKERRGSTGCMEDYFKRKREGSGEVDIEGEEEWAQKRSKKTERVQDGVREGKKS